MFPTELTLWSIRVFQDHQLLHYSFEYSSWTQLYLNSIFLRFNGPDNFVRLYKAIMKLSSSKHSRHSTSNIFIIFLCIGFVEGKLPFVKWVGSSMSWLSLVAWFYHWLIHESHLATIGTCPIFPENGIKNNGHHYRFLRFLLKVKSSFHLNHALKRNEKLEMWRMKWLLNKESLLVIEGVRKDEFEQPILSKQNLKTDKAMIHHLIYSNRKFLCLIFWIALVLILLGLSV